jgi:hypothetical protein
MCQHISQPEPSARVFFTIESPEHDVSARGGAAWAGVVVATPEAATNATVRRIPLAFFERFIVVISSRLTGRA